MLHAEVVVDPDVAALEHREPRLDTVGVNFVDDWIEKETNEGRFLAFRQVIDRADSGT